MSQYCANTTRDTRDTRTRPLTTNMIVVVSMVTECEQINYIEIHQSFIIMYVCIICTYVVVP